jgi:carbamoyl-phosphate synthase large subunit
LSTVLVIGSGPIVIGQACEFDYSGTQACRALSAEGYRVVLVNSNPATIMTDPEIAHRTYIEPLVPEVLEAVIARERPDALLPTLGGQTGLNLAMKLHELGVLERYGVEMIGANATAIATAEDRGLFRAAMKEIGLAVPDSGFADNLDDALRTGDRIGYPVIVRPSYILGGGGTGIADDHAALAQIAAAGLDASPINEILIERSIAGWKEYELEVMRDRADNCVIVCSIENFDPMGVHTGDSVTVAPAQTLSDVEYQKMRDAAFACIRRIGVETGGSNIQFAIDPASGDMVVIEMNPRVSRSSALASKATGFPIAKIAARLAVGYTLDEIRNDITGETPASFEPTIDYVVTKIPRWAFEKFPGIPDVLGTRMQSVGEAMAIGRSFPESLQKALRSLETGRAGLNCDPGEGRYDDMGDEELVARASVATPDRPFHLEAALRRGVSAERLHRESGVDPWFLDQISRICAERARLGELGGPAALARRDWKQAKRLGFSDAQLAYLWQVTEAEVRQARLAAGVRATFKTVDTCAAEFAATTPYHYSTYEDSDEVVASSTPKVVILGSGPNRIGQGVEFDYCCVQASFALHDAGFETVMVNCNPETVSTDYDTSDRLYFEPVTVEDVQNVLDVEMATGQVVGVIVALGGQTPLKLSGALGPELVMGTSPASIDLAEDRERWNGLCERLGIPQAAGATATGVDEALSVAAKVGYPVLVRPSYVLGGRAMEIAYGEADLERAMAAMAVSGTLGREGGLSAERPVLVDKFLEDAIEVDVDAVRDVTGETLIGAVMEHVEEAGVHSGDSACVVPPPTLNPATIATIEAFTRRIADGLDVRGPLNVQYAVQRGPEGQPSVFVIEANPRASRTVPFVSKATGVPLAKVAARVMAGASLAGLRAEGLLKPPVTGFISVKEAVLPFDRFPDADSLLGPEMRSTGEVMGIDATFGLAFAKSQLAAGDKLARTGTVFISVADRDKAAGLEAAKRFVEAGFAIAATSGTAAYLQSAGVPVSIVVAKVGAGAVPPLGDGVTEPGAEAPEVTAPGAKALGMTEPGAEAPEVTEPGAKARAMTEPGAKALEARAGEGAVDAVELIRSGQVQLVVNTPRGRGPRADGAHIRGAARQYKVPLLTTVAAARAAAAGVLERGDRPFTVKSLQEHHAGASLQEHHAGASLQEHHAGASLPEQKASPGPAPAGRPGAGTEA